MIVRNESKRRSEVGKCLDTDTLVVGRCGPTYRERMIRGSSTPRNALSLSIGPFPTRVLCWLEKIEQDLEAHCDVCIEHAVLVAVTERTDLLSVKQRRRLYISVR